MRKLPPIEKDGADTDPLLMRRRQVECFLVLQRLKRAVEMRTLDHFRQRDLHGISPAQANVLMVLFQRRRAMTAREIHNELGISEVTVSRFVGTLVRNGWVKKMQSPLDGRKTLLSPTPKARDHLTTFIQIANTLLDETFTGLNDTTVLVLNEAIQHIDQNLAPRLSSNRYHHKT